MPPLWYLTVNGQLRIVASATPNLGVTTVTLIYETHRTAIKLLHSK
jgi:hypothetical protein